MRYLAAFALTVAVAVAVAACGTTSAPGAPGAPGGPTPAGAFLSFTIAASPGQPAVHGTLRCDPAGGTVPDASTACRTLLGMKHDPFAAPSKAIVCPMIMGTGGKITLTGTWFGKPVHRVVLDGECDMALYGVLARILR